ncbi:MAG: hypothetical protein MUD08_05805 [Cytophagales bacterium]|nr:hypothetical protein [Cytophagales bacterium]
MNDLTTTKPPTTEAAMRRIGVADMLRGACLMLLTLGCVLLWFHDTARFRQPVTSMVVVTRLLAQVGVFGLLAAAGMGMYYLRTRRSRAEQWSLAVLTLSVFLLYQTLHPAIWPARTWPVWWVLVSVVLGMLGWIAAGVFRDRLLLNDEAYKTFMGRKYDFRKVMLVFGQSPLFFFGAMLGAVQLLAWLTAFSAGFRWFQIDFAGGYLGLPRDFGYRLPRVYLTCFCILAVLYPLCKAYASLKSAAGWLRYL